MAVGGRKRAHVNPAPWTPINISVSIISCNCSGNGKSDKSTAEVRRPISKSGIKGIMGRYEKEE